jgi:hypothetical protein
MMQAATFEHPAMPKGGKFAISVFEMIPGLHPSADSG